MRKVFVQSLLGLICNMNIEALLLRAIEASPNFPRSAILGRERFTGCESTVIAAENIEQRKVLLQKNPDSQTRSRLESFVAGLSPFIGKVAIGGCLWTATHRYWIFVDPETERLLHWEEYPRGFA
jgi:hypothetical protein